MGWQDLLEPSSRLVMPWLGGRRVYRGGRTWRVSGRLPGEFGWYEFEVAGLRARLICAAEPDLEYGDDWHKSLGYLVGNRLITWYSRIDPDPNKLINQTVLVNLVEPGLDRFVVVEAVVDPERRVIYRQQLFPLGPEDQVRRAFIDREETVDAIAGVTPALDLAFRFATHRRNYIEARRAELERRHLEEERAEQARQNLGTGVGRRVLAATDFSAAARAALAVSGAELLDVRPGGNVNERVIQFRLDNRRFECVVQRETFRVIDSGICLTNEYTGEKGDTYLTLESLPSVVRQAIAEDKLVVYRHVDGG